MFKKPLAIFAIIGVLVALRAPAADAQFVAGPLLTQIVPANGAPTAVAQNGLACLGPVQGAAAIAQNPAITLLTVLGRIGLGVAQLVANNQPCLALYNGRYVWQIWVNTGGGPVRRVVDALTGADVAAP